jgi:cytochrome c oxidase cbb3-type subunit III
MNRLRSGTGKVERALPSALAGARCIEPGLARSTLKIFLVSCFPYFVCLVLFPFSSCEREQRVLVNRPPWIATQRTEYEVTTMRNGESRVKTWYGENSWAMSEGKRLYESYNCVGCHAHGGGGMGPPLMDQKWIYGSDPLEVYGSIRYGRPNGMPSFRGKISEDQIWEIVAYVRSLSGLVNQWAANARDDHIKGAPPPNSVPEGTPHDSSEPQP